MSSNPERLKLTAKRTKKPSDVAKNNSKNLKQNNNEQVRSKNDRNVIKMGLKRRLSGEGEMSNKKTRLHPKTEVSKTGSTTKPKDSELGNLANKRLVQLRQNLKDPRSTSKSDSVKKSTNRDTIPILTRDDKAVVRKVTDFKIPIKRSVNERLKLPKATEEQSPKTVISKEKNNLKRSHDDLKRKSPLSPLERSYLRGKISDRGIVSESKSTESTPDTSFRSPEGYICISEASDTESSAKKLTPTNQRLTSIKCPHSSSSSDKTLTPGSSRDSPNTAIVEASFKTPLRSSNVTGGLKIPLNRSLFKSRTETAVQTERNIFGSPKGHAESRSTSIFGAPVQANIFQNNATSLEKTDNIFAPNNPRLNNNTIVSRTVTNNQSPSHIFGETSRKNIISNCTVKDQLSRNGLLSSFPTTNSNSSNDTQTRSVYPSGPEKREITTDPSSIFLPKQIQSSGKSANDRFARIKNESSNTYRKNESLGQPTDFRENSLGAMPGIQDFESQGTLQRHVSPPSKPETASTAFLTQNWVSTQPGTSGNVDTTMSDSMCVNVNDSLLNKSELADPIEDVSMEWDSVPQATELPQLAFPQPRVSEKENIVCVVTDTNVFMHFLPIIKEAISVKLAGSQKVKIYVPWMVLKELDHLKDRAGEPTRSIALEAERFINKCLTETNSKVIGQSVLEVNKQQDVGTSPDDKILACSLQVKEKYETVILLSNDINLRNGAIVNGVETCTPQQILSKLKCSKFHKIRRKLMLLWSEIICERCKQAYGDAWSKMDMLQNPPWSMIECIKRFRKYWAAVFRGVLSKHCQKHIDKIYGFLMEHKGDLDDDSADFNQFMELVLDFLYFLKDMQNHKASIEKNTDEIVEIANSS